MAAARVQRVSFQVKHLLSRSKGITEHSNHVKSVNTYSKSICSGVHSGYMRDKYESSKSCQLRSFGPGTSVKAPALNCRNFADGSKGVSEKELKRKIDDLTDQFMEARDLMADARESKGTVYFSDDLVDAKQAVEDTLTAYKALLSQLDAQQTQHVLRSIGLKMQELEAQLKMMEDELLE